MSRSLKREVYQIWHHSGLYEGPGGEPIFSEPVVIKRGSTVEMWRFPFIKDFLKKLRYARIWLWEFDGTDGQADYPLMREMS